MPFNTNALQLYDWACRDETEQHKHRQLMLFSLCNRFGNMKAIAFISQVFVQISGKFKESFQLVCGSRAQESC